MRTLSRMLCGGLVGAGLVLCVMQQVSHAQSTAGDAKKRVVEAQRTLNELRAEQKKMRDQMRVEFEDKDQWKNTVIRFKKSKAAYEQARKQALAAMRAKPEYKQTVKDREALKTKLDELQEKRNPDADAIAQAGAALTEKGIALKKMETTAMAEDEKAAVAKEEYEAALKEMKALEEEIEDALASDPDYEALLTKLDNAEQQLDAARTAQKSAGASRPKSGSGAGGGGRSKRGY